MGANSTALNVNETESLDVLLADLSLAEEHVAKAAEVQAVTVIEPDEEEIIAEMDMSVYGGFVEEIPISEADKPKTKVAKEKPAKAAKAPKEPKAPKAAKEPKEPKEAKPKAERKYYASKIERLTDRLGEQFEHLMLLEKADLSLSAEAQQAKKAESMVFIMSAGSKVQNRQTFILEYVAGKSAKLNKVISMALSLIKNTGHLTTGAEGNYLAAMKAEGYSLNAAKAMSNNSLLALKSLKVIKEDTKGKFVFNENSVILEKLQALSAY